MAVNYLKEQAAEKKLTISPRVCNLTDIPSLQLKDSCFDLVVITYYLDRLLFPLVKSIIKDNGYFFMETFYQSPTNENQGVSSQYKLKPGELLAEFKDWKVLFYEENQQEGRQTIFCQKANKKSE